jgi:hypothetical protein
MRLFIRTHAPASDGLWLPKCDLAQYEAGQRVAIVRDAVEGRR